MEQDYYKTIINQIKELMKTSPIEAIKKIEIELNMPYIPKKYETKFVHLLEDIKYKIKRDATANNTLSRREVLKIITKNDTIKMPMAIAKLKDLNLRPMIEDLQTIISNGEISNIIKTVIYECCVEQSIDYSFEWNDMLVNPVIVGSTIQLSVYQNAYAEISNTIVQNPSLQSVAHSYLELYALNTFPAFIDEKEGLAPIIIAIAHESMGLPRISPVDAERLEQVKRSLDSKK